MKRACTATTQKGTPCQRRPLKGRDVCKSHSGDPDVGRPTKLTPDAAERFEKAVRLGAYNETAAQACGVHVATFYHWMEKGEADKDAGNATQYRDFFDRITRAIAEAEEHAILALRQAFTGKQDASGKVLVFPDWRAAAFYLERKYPGRWGRRVEVGGEVGLKFSELSKAAAEFLESEG